MTRDVKVHLLPALFEPDEVRGGIAVILDILRASTTITHALAHGAKAVIPAGEVDEARRIAVDYPKGSVLLGGEREGVLIEGFDLDNNPFAYTPEAVAGMTIVFTTSNGTKALLRADKADRILRGGDICFSRANRNRFVGVIITVADSFGNAGGIHAAAQVAIGVSACARGDAGSCDRATDNGRPGH